MRERRELEAKAKEWEEKVHQSMMLKFGRVVDLDHLGCVASNRTTEELRAKLQQQETQQARELVALQVSGWDTSPYSHTTVVIICSLKSRGPRNSWWAWSERTHST